MVARPRNLCIVNLVVTIRTVAPVPVTCYARCQHWPVLLYHDDRFSLVTEFRKTLYISKLCVDFFLNGELTNHFITGKLSKIPNRSSTRALISTFGMRSVISWGLRARTSDQLAYLPIHVFITTNRLQGMLANSSPASTCRRAFLTSFLSCLGVSWQMVASTSCPGVQSAKFPFEFIFWGLQVSSDFILLSDLVWSQSPCDFQGVAVVLSIDDIMELTSSCVYRPNVNDPVITAKRNCLTISQDRCQPMHHA